MESITWIGGLVHDKPLDYHYRLYRALHVHWPCRVGFFIICCYFWAENLLWAIFRRAKPAFVQGHTIEHMTALIRRKQRSDSVCIIQNLFSLNRIFSITFNRSQCETETSILHVPKQTQKMHAPSTMKCAYSDTQVILYCEYDAVVYFSTGN